MKIAKMVKKVADWKVEENTVTFFDENKKELWSKSLDEVIKAYLWVEDNSWE